MGNSVTLRMLIADAIADEMGSLVAIAHAEDITDRFQKSLRAHGLEIHNVRDGQCVRMPPPPGRPMTRDEQELVRHG